MVALIFKRCAAIPPPSAKTQNPQAKIRGYMALKEIGIMMMVHDGPGGVIIRCGRKGRKKKSSCQCFWILFQCNQKSF